MMKKASQMVIGLCVAVWAVSAMAQQRDLFKEAPWTTSLGLGHMGVEGDEPINDALSIQLKLGYSYSPRWEFEGGLDIMPSIAKNDLDDPNRFRLEDDIWGVRFSGDVLFHLRNTKDMHIDPYLAAGPYFTLYSKALEHGSGELGVDGGGGVFFHFNDAWALRGDARAGIGGMYSEFRTFLTIGVTYRWGTELPPVYEATGGDIDSDGDGLTDKDETVIGTDPYDPDTDKDGLSDGEEVHKFKTDPLNPDSDWDALKDGAEVLKYLSNPLNPDTDNGGVADGHEVIEDTTDPLDPSDDLQLFTLNIEFDYDKAILKPEYHSQLDVVIKVLHRDPASTARVEGHADKRKTSKHEYNIKLSERRAKAVVDYIVNTGGIDRTRLTYKGYGYTRPVAPNDTETNMARNRRTEIYIRKGSAPASATPPSDVAPQ